LSPKTKGHLDKARELSQNGEYSKALECFSLIPKGVKLGIKDLLLKARLILLSDNSGKSVLAAAEHCLNTALTIDPDNLETLIELGFYQWRVMDNKKAGRAFFDKALCISRKCLQEALEGLREIEETEIEKGNKSGQIERFESILKNLASLGPEDSPSDFARPTKQILAFHFQPNNHKRQKWA